MAGMLLLTIDCHWRERAGRVTAGADVGARALARDGRAAGPGYTPNRAGVSRGVNPHRAENAMPALTPTIDRDGLTFYLGDCRAVLSQLPEQSVQLCVTSPPYFGLRSYLAADHPDKSREVGREATVAAYVAALVEVFTEVRRVLRRDGTAWLNLGDCYNTSPPGNKRPMAKSRLNGADTSASYRARLEATQQTHQEGRRLLPGLKPKDLVGVPWAVAFALRDAGWYLRADCVWHKSCHMPEAVRDRPTKAHEYIFQLARSPRYYYDAEAVREVTPGGDPHGHNRGTVWRFAPRHVKGAHFATFPPELAEPCVLAGSRPGDVVLDPFAGAGTTALVARQHGRRFVGVELNPDYLDLTRRRLWPGGEVAAA